MPVEEPKDVEKIARECCQVSKLRDKHKRNTLGANRPHESPKTGPRVEVEKMTSVNEDLHHFAQGLIAIQARNRFAKPFFLHGRKIARLGVASNIDTDPVRRPSLRGCQLRLAREFNPLIFNLQKSNR